MSAAASSSKIFGVRVTDSTKKVIVAVALLIPVGVYLYTSHTEESAAPLASAAIETPTSAVPQAPPKLAKRVSRTRTTTSDRGTLRLRAIDARNGDIDPTLRLDLLGRLQSAQIGPGGRSLFEAGTAPAPVLAKPVKTTTIMPLPKPVTIAPPGTNTPPPAVPIPLKFYGFVHPKGAPTADRGFFLDGEAVLVASEGDLLKQRYRVVQLTATTATLEDIVTKSKQPLRLVPEAQNNGS